MNDILNDGVMKAHGNSAMDLEVEVSRAEKRRNQIDRDRLAEIEDATILLEAQLKRRPWSAVAFEALVYWCFTLGFFTTLYLGRKLFDYLAGSLNP